MVNHNVDPLSKKIDKSPLRSNIPHRYTNRIGKFLPKFEAIILGKIKVLETGFDCF